MLCSASVVAWRASRAWGLQHFRTHTHTHDTMVQLEPYTSLDTLHHETDKGKTWCVVILIQTCLHTHSSHISLIASLPPSHTYTLVLINVCRYTLWCKHQQSTNFLLAAVCWMCLGSSTNDEVTDTNTIKTEHNSPKYHFNAQRLLFCVSGDFKTCFKDVSFGLESSYCSYWDFLIQNIVS